MLLCEKYSIWPLNGCTYSLICAGYLALFAPVNVGSIIWHRFNYAGRRHSALRSGTLPFLYFLVLLCHVVLVLLPLGFLATNFHDVAENPLKAALFIALYLQFWVAALVRFVGNRHYHEQPMSLVVAYAGAGLLVLLPLFSWSHVFPTYGPSASSHRAYFITSGIFILTILLTVLSKGTLKRESDSTWANFASKLALIFPYIWPKKSVRLQLQVLVCLLLLAVGRIINIALPLYSKWIVDELAGPHRFCYDLILISTGLKFLQGSGAMGGFLNTLRSFFWIRIQQYTTLEIEVDLFAHLHSLSLKWHLSRKTGQVLRIMDRGTNSINSLLSYILFNVVPTIVDIILAVVFFFIMFNAYFGFLVLFTMVLYIAVTVVMTEWRTKFRREMNENENKASGIAVDSLLNYETVKHYNAEQLELKRYKDAILLYQAAEFKTMASLSLLNFTQNSIIGVGLVTGSLLVAYLISLKDSTLTAGDYVLFTTYMYQLYAPLNFFGTIYRTIQKSFVDMENMFDLLKEFPDITDSPGALDLSPASAGEVEFRNVSFSYNPEKPVLENISFVVPPGQTYALVGPSGGGKTTIVRLLFRLYDVTDGQVLFGGRDIREIRVRSLRQSMGIVPQDTVLFNETIRYNILYGRPSATDAEIVDAARAAAIHDFIVSHPDGYDCLVGERGLKLSGGEKQRVAIARTVLKQPQYILLDEATSALDSATERSIQTYLAELCRTRTCIVVAHRLSTIVNADKILVLSGGRIVESGAHQELLALKGTYAEMWRIQNGDHDKT